MISARPRRRSSILLSRTLGLWVLLAHSWGFAESSLVVERVGKPRFFASWPRGVSCLLKAYPLDLCDYEGGQVVWCDGTRMPYHIGPEAPKDLDRLGHADYEKVLARADLRLQMREPYPKGVDAGRMRYQAFFEKMYGASEHEVMASTMRLEWPGKGSGYHLRVAKKHGLPDRLRRIGERLVGDVALKPYLVPPGGSFKWRWISGSRRLSTHSFGIAVDIALKHARYWRWDESFRALKQHFEGIKKIEVPAGKVLPAVIVEAFAREGFIWGGHWAHFDTMHFEYRPELFCDGAL